MGPTRAELEKLVKELRENDLHDEADRIEATLPPKPKEKEP